jgi:hypothetical protein
MRALRGVLDSATDGELMDLTEPCALALADALQGKLQVTPARLLALSRLMVWAADGLLDGALRQEGITFADLHPALASAWHGIVAAG